MAYEYQKVDITLPISGKLITLREGSGFGDKSLGRNNKKFYDVMYDYFASVVVAIDGSKVVTAHDLKNLLIPDQEFLAVECYKINYGDVFEFDFTCPKCGHADPYGAQKGVPLDKLTRIPLDPELTGTDPTVSITLPKTKVIVVVGMLNGHKEGILLAQASGEGADPNQSDFLSLRSFDGRSDFSYEEIRDLPAGDHKAIRLARRRLITGYDPIVNVECSKCGFVSVFNMFQHKDFFLPAG